MMLSQARMHGRYLELADAVRRGGVLVLSGAGLSTESGIPDYRGPSGLARRGQPGPMTYQSFIGSAAARRRYWARSHVGWRAIAAARPNAGHLAVAELQRQGLVSAVITQNVDGLHQAAGSREVTELHGSLHRVRCLDCGARTPRTELDERLRAANPAWPGASALINADGDALVDDEVIEAFNVVGCLACGGALKPDVVFFGENVPPARVSACYDLTERARALLVLGSSLAVLSGLRFVRRAAERGIPVIIVNQGPTRGDDLATLRIDAPLGRLLTQTLGALAHQ